MLRAEMVRISPIKTVKLCFLWFVIQFMCFAPIGYVVYFDLIYPLFFSLIYIEI